MPYNLGNFGNKTYKTLRLASLKLKAMQLYGVVHFEFEGSLSKTSRTLLPWHRIELKLARMCRIGYCTRCVNVVYTEELVSKLFKIFLGGPFFGPPCIYILVHIHRVPKRVV